jgi:hypothetical protein
MTIARQVGIAASRIESTQRANEFGQICTYLLRSGENGVLVARQLAEAANAPERVKAVLQKSAVSSLSSLNTSEILELRDLAAGWLETLRNVSVFERILSDGGFRVIPARTRVGAVTLSPNADHVIEEAMKPLTNLEVTGGGVFDLVKAVALLVITSELARSPLATTVISAELRSRLALETDTLVFAELQNSLVASQGSAGTTAANSFSDLAFLLANVSTGARSRLYFVAAPNVMKLLSTRNASGTQAFPGLGPQGGTLLNTPALVSDGLDSGVLLLMDAAQIAAADDGISLSTAKHASVAMDDSPTSGSALTSLWQQNMLGIKVERFFGVQALSSSALAYVTGVA